MARKLCMGIIAIAMALSLSTMGSAPQAVAADVEWVTLGVNVPLSGGGAAWGLPALRAAEMEVAKVNKDGGLKLAGKTYKFKVFTSDNKYTSSGGALFAKRLVEEQKGTYVCGVVGSAPCLGALEITEPAKVLTVGET